MISCFEGTRKVKFNIRRLLRAGIHLIEVLYDDVPVPKSPFRVSVVEGCDPSRVRAFGPGLEGGITNKPNCFTVETRYRRIGAEAESPQAYKRKKPGIKPALCSAEEPVREAWA